MDNQALFDPEGKPLESFYVFIYWYYSNLLKYGNGVTSKSYWFRTIFFPWNNNCHWYKWTKRYKKCSMGWWLWWNKVKNIDGNSLTYEFNRKAGNIDIKCIFENNSNQEVVKRKFVCSYYIDSKFLSPRRLQRMVGIRDL